MDNYGSQRFLYKAFHEYRMRRDTQAGFYAQVVHWILIQAFIGSDAGCMAMAKVVSCE